MDYNTKLLSMNLKFYTLTNPALNKPEVHFLAVAPCEIFDEAWAVEGMIHKSA